MDQLQIKDLKFLAAIMVFPGEKEQAKFVISKLILWYDQGGDELIWQLLSITENCVSSGRLVSGALRICWVLVAYKLVERTFETYPLVQEIELELKNLAPVHLPFDTCSVTIHCRKQCATLRKQYGDKQATWNKLSTNPVSSRASIFKESSVLATEPWEVWTDSFVNPETMKPATCVMLETLLAIGSEMGRVREVHWGLIWLIDPLLCGDGPDYTDDSYLCLILYSRTLLSWVSARNSSHFTIRS